VIRNEGKEKSEGTIEGLSEKKRKQKLGEDKERMKEDRIRKRK
jgi:hypothetical protein